MSLNSIVNIAIGVAMGFMALYVLTVISLYA
jgi:hypothetical protein